MKTDITMIAAVLANARPGEVTREREVVRFSLSPLSVQKGAATPSVPFRDQIDNLLTS
jgi:hypothetical protein